MDEWKEIAKKGKSGLRGVLRSGTTRETQGGGNKLVRKQRHRDRAEFMTGPSQL